MKKTNLLLAFCAIFVIGLSSCKPTVKCDCENQEQPKGTFCYTDEGRQPEMINYKEIVTMLTDYDTSRIAPLEEALGYQDSRLNNYNFSQFKKYLGNIEALSKKAKIEITGISFISAVKKNYNNTGKNYQDLIYVPTTLINGKQIPFDPVQSVLQGKLVTFKEMLAKNGYNWIYNTREDFETGKKKDNNYSIPITKQSKAGFIDVFVNEDESGAGNMAKLSPPF